MVWVSWYHKFNERFHVAFETYVLGQRNVLNITDPAGIIANGGYPFAPGIVQFNAPNFARCSDPNVVTCTARAIAALAYWNYKFTPRDNLTLRTEYCHDEQGQRTGTATRYVDIGLGWQHWFWPAGRDSSGSDLLQVVQRTRIQRQFRRDTGRDRSQQILHVDVCGGPHLAFLITGSGIEGQLASDCR